MQLSFEGFTFVHAEASRPERFRYLDCATAAHEDLSDSTAQAIFCGHVHKPALYGVTASEKIIAFTPIPGEPIPLPGHRRWLAVMGSVGQPRDGDPAAAYAILDTLARTLTHYRVGYDIAAARSENSRRRPAHLPRRSLGPRTLTCCP